MEEKPKGPINTNVYPKQKKKKKGIVKKILVATLCVGAGIAGATYVYHKVQEYNESIYNPENDVEKKDVVKYKEIGNEIKNEVLEDWSEDIKLSRYFFNNEDNGKISVYVVTKDDRGPNAITKYIIDGKGATSFEDSLNVISQTNLSAFKSELYYYDMSNIWRIKEQGNLMPLLDEYYNDDWNYRSAQNGYYKYTVNDSFDEISWTVGCWIKLVRGMSVKYLHCEWEVTAPFDFATATYDITEYFSGEHTLKMTKCEEMGDNCIKMAYINMNQLGDVFGKEQENDSELTPTNFDLGDGRWTIILPDEDDMQF